MKAAFAALSLGEFRGIPILNVKPVPKPPLTPGLLTSFDQMGLGFLPKRSPLDCFSMGQAPLTQLSLLCCKSTNTKQGFRGKPAGLRYEG